MAPLTIRRFAQFSALLATLMIHAALAAGQTVTDTNLVVTPHGSGFAQPTQLRFLGSNPNEYFVTEKETGIVKHVLNGSVANALDLSVANDHFERGLLGIALHPDFATNDQVYLYYSHTTNPMVNGAWTDNRLERYLWDSNTRTLSVDNSFAAITFGTTSDGTSIGANHNAGPINFGLDGSLYGTTGDLNRNEDEQNFEGAPVNSAMVGGIYRLGDDGTIPSDNPFTAHAETDFHRWYAYGVRNTYGAAFDPVTGHLWDTENGPDSYDEINHVAAGFNSGWEDIMGPDSRDPQGVGDLVSLDGDTGYSDPEFSFLTPVAVTGIEFLAGSALGASYDDAVVVGGSGTSELYLFRLNQDRDAFVLSGDLADLVADSATERNLVRFGQGFNTVTDVQVGPDGALYVVTLFGTVGVHRIAMIPEPTTVGLLVIATAVLIRFRRR